MFLGLHPFNHLVFLVAGENRYLGLQDHRAAVELFGHEVHRGAVFAVTVVDGLPVGVQPRVFW
ncbi:hypothetical protein D3C78_1171120 [compost metagenome]